MISPADKQKLRSLFAKRSRAEQKTLLALIRAHNDKTLLAALAPAKPKRKAKTLAREVDGALRPLLASSAEKAELLVEHLARKRRKELAIVPKGVAATRNLRTASAPRA